MAIYEIMAYFKIKYMYIFTKAIMNYLSVILDLKMPCIYRIESNFCKNAPFTGQSTALDNYNKASTMAHIGIMVAK